MYRGRFNSNNNHRGASGHRNFRGASMARKFIGQKHIDPSKFVRRAVITEASKPYASKHLFKDFMLDERIKNNVRAKGYVTPTPIQDEAIPHVLAGSDVVGIANTGTGKTAAFLLPLINKTLLNSKESILVIVPTRELALQIADELKSFTNGLRIFGVSCFGGASISKQIIDLRRPNNFVIGTPGRLKDLIERKVLDLGKYNTLVLDEADRMLDMGFINEIRYMVSKMPKNRQTLFFSATFSREIEALVKDFLRSPVTISVKKADTAANIEQDIVRVKENDKIGTLCELLKKDGFDKVLVFGRTKHGVEKLTKALVLHGFKAESIHGNKTQSRRIRALDLFKRDHVQVLVATDVAARGIDVAGISHVINYDLPATYEDYIHRIGRTGRGDEQGKAITFVE